MHYRKEIDGLRAVAVVPVILFHAGAFAGVDVFFVISGLPDYDADPRRARRILPALFVVLGACVALAWLHLLFARLVGNFGLAPGCNGNHAITAACATSRTPEIAVWGNSYAMHLVEGLGAAWPGKGLVQLAQSACATNPEIDTRKAGQLDCGEFNRRALATILDTPSIRRVLVSSREAGALRL